MTMTFDNDLALSRYARSSVAMTRSGSARQSYNFQFIISNFY